MTDELVKVKPDSPLVKSFVNEPDIELKFQKAMAMMLEAVGLLGLMNTSERVTNLWSDIKSTQDDIRTLKLKIAGLEMENGKLQERLKKRFGGIDNRLEQVEKRSSGE